MPRSLPCRLGLFLGLVCTAAILAGCELNATPGGKPRPGAMTTGEKPKFVPMEENKTDEPPAVSTTESSAEDPLKEGNPFRVRIDCPEFPKGLEWIKSRELTNEDVKGKFVILDFWTYCCINCMHILPELKKLEKEFPNELVVIGVHSAKFETEKERENILEAVQRYEIEHPVVNDADHKFWETFEVSSWPTICMIAPDGKLVLYKPGEVEADELRDKLVEGIKFYREKGVLKEGPLANDRGPEDPDAPLKFPGKVIADEKGNRLFISDSNHNRILMTTLTGEVQAIIGSGQIGKADGSFAEASFDHPQGTVVSADGKTLYVADTENHLLRKVDLEAKTVTTIAGIGSQARGPWPGMAGITKVDDVPERFVGKPRETALNSPWDLWIHGDALYIAMAGPHQIWKMPLDESEIGPYAGNGREDIVDGPLMPQLPYQRGFSSFAQPSGLSSDGKWLFVADSEGSSIRAVPFDGSELVRTVVGTNELRGGRLFAFGDVDGPRADVLLQHCLGVAYVDGKIYVTDTYNNKIKEVDAATGDTKTIAGGGKDKSGKTDDPPLFDEPAGISHAKGVLYIADTNNHLIRTLEIATGRVGTLTISGPGIAPAKGAALVAPTDVVFTLADTGHQEKVTAATVKPVEGKITLHVSLVPPKGWKISDMGTMPYAVESPQEKGPVDRGAFVAKKLPKPTGEFDIVLPTTGEGDDVLKVYTRYYYCPEGDDGKTCKFGEVTFTAPISVKASGAADPVKLEHKIPK